MLAGSFSSDHHALKSRWGTLNLNGKTLNLDGGTLNLDGGTRSPYNLSSGNNYANVEVTLLENAKTF